MFALLSASLKVHKLSNYNCYNNYSTYRLSYFIAEFVTFIGVINI